eukprot:152735_1
MAGLVFSNEDFTHVLVVGDNCDINCDINCALLLLMFDIAHATTTFLFRLCLKSYIEIVTCNQSQVSLTNGSMSHEWMSHERFAKSFYTVVNPNTRFAYEQEHCLLFGIVNFQSEHMSNILFVSSDDLTTIKFDHTTQENTRNSGSIEMKVSERIKGGESKVAFINTPQFRGSSEFNERMKFQKCTTHVIMKPKIEKDESGKPTLKRCGAGRHQLISVTPQVLHKSSPANMMSSLHHKLMNTSGIEDDLLWIPENDYLIAFKLRFRIAVLDFLDHLRFITQLSDCALATIRKLINDKIPMKWNAISLKFLYIYVTYIWKNCKGFVDMVNDYLAAYPTELPSILAEILSCSVQIQNKALSVHQSMRHDQILLGDLESIRPPLRSIKFGIDKIIIKKYDSLNTTRHRQIFVHNHDAGQGVSNKQMTKKVSDCMIIRTYKLLIKDDYQSAAGRSAQNTCEQTNSGIIGNVTSVTPSHCTGNETGFKTKPAGDKYADILKEYDEDKHRNVLEASLEISESICNRVNGKMCMGAPLIASVFPERRPAKAPYFTELYPQELADVLKPFTLTKPTKKHKAHPIGAYIVNTLEYYDAHVLVAPGMRSVFYQGLCVLRGNTDCKEHETMDISHHFKIGLMSKMKAKDCLNPDDIKWDNSESLEYLTQENIGSFADNIPCVELEKFWKQNKLSLYEFEKIRIGAQQIEYRMPVWKYVNWSDTNKEKITNLVLRLPSKREWIERWLTNKILGKLVVGDFKRFKDTEIAKYIADHEETIVDNGGLIFNRQKLNQYGDDKQEIPKLVRVLSKKIGINEQDIYDEMRRYLEEEYDETDFTDDEEDFEVIVEQKAIYALTPFDTNIVLNRE